MTILPLRRALDRSGLPTRAYGSEGSGDVPRRTEDDAPPTVRPSRRA